MIQLKINEKKLLMFFLVMSFLSNFHRVWAQGTVTDYKRAYEIYSLYANKALNVDVKPVSIVGQDAFWYVVETKDGRKYVRLDACTTEETPLFDQNNLAQQLSKENGKQIDGSGLYLRSVNYDGENKILNFEDDSNTYIYKVEDKSLSVKKKEKNVIGNQRHWMEVDDERGGNNVTSPDGKWMAYIRENNVWARRLSDGKERQLSFDGTEGFYYSSWIQWAPDSRKIMTCKLRPAVKHYVYYVESSPEGRVQPILHKQEYAKPGDELNFKIPCIFEVETGRAIEPSTELFSSQFSIQQCRWDTDSRAVTFEFNERGHKTYRVLELSAETGKVRTLIEEHSDKYVNYPFLWRYDLEGGRYILWASERDNYKNLYMYDRKMALVDHQITRGKWYVREVVKVDEKNKIIYFTANGDVEGEDPYLIHYYKVGFDGKHLTPLTPEHGTHQAVFTDDFKYMIDTYSTVTEAPVTVLRSAYDGHILKTIVSADLTALKSVGWKAPESFCAKGRDGKTDIWGLIVRPSNFDPAKKYPIVEYIYAGPGSQYVPKSFHSFYWDMTNLAELGFIVVQVDGMGTSFRSRDFETVCYKNLKDAGLPDHIAWIKAAATKYSCMDTTRVGIFGASAGGQESTAAVLFHPEFYKAAYSACGCQDNRMDKVWWNELWMGYPVDSSYIRSSNVTNAWRLTRPLMLVVGELDDNVDPASTMQVANALIKANKNFELVVLPGVHHTLGEHFGEHKRYDFFVKYLLNVEPPKWEDLKLKN